MTKRASPSPVEPMSKVDTAWLRMDRPDNPMMITGVIVLDQRLDLERFKRLLAQRFLSFHRFRQKAVDSATGASWQLDGELDLDWHVRTVQLPGARGKTELQDLVSDLASTPLDRGRPLWQFHVVDRFEHGSALISRIHHCYADGIALIQVLLTLTDTRLTAEKHVDLARAWLKDDGDSVAGRLAGSDRSGLGRAMRWGEKALQTGLSLAVHPAKLAHVVYEGGEIARELAVALTLSDDPPTRLRGELGARKRCAWAEPIELEPVKIVGRALGCTVNDVLMATATGALRSYLRELGDDVDGITIRATVPVNLRPLEHARKLGNHFGLVFLDLPIGEPNPLRRLEIVAAKMREIKNSRQAIVAFGLLAALGMSPAAIQGPALDLFSRKATAVATNVPGPEMPLFLAGSRIREQMFWVPQTGSIGLGISILSYEGKVHFGLIADAKRVPDPSAIVRRFRPEFEKLLLIALMEDWHDPITAADAAATLRHFVPDQADARAPKKAYAKRAGSPARPSVKRAVKPARKAISPARPISAARPKPMAKGAIGADGFAAAIDQFRGRKPKP